MVRVSSRFFRKEAQGWVCSCQYYHAPKEHMCQICKDTKSKQKNKFNAKGQTYNGVWFHSTFELNVYQALEWKLKAGEIKKLERQVKIDIRVNGVHITNYYIDMLVTHNDGFREYIEAKGVETQDWKIKWRLLEAILDEYDPGATMTLEKMSQSKHFKKW